MKSPFKFLDAFTLKDKDAFFGRDQEIDTLYSLVLWFWCTACPARGRLR